MAARAILALAQPEAPSQWPYHKCKWSSLPAHLLWKGDRRMEAENYLSSGYGIRLALEERAVGWMRFGSLAFVSQPSRLKGIQVGPEVGTPFLAATQVFDLRPVPRKFLALEKTEGAEGRFVSAGTMLVTCSGSVGRATIATACHDQILISHDLLRVQARTPTYAGWLYAYLRSPQARAMMTGAQYGHIIKHLEVSHLEALPVPVVNAELAAQFQTRMEKILDLRNRAHQLTLDAERLFEEAVGPLQVEDWGETGFSVKASSFMKGRRRLEAVPHNPGSQQILAHLKKNGIGMESLKTANFKVWLPSRFKRTPAQDGVWFLDSSDLFETNPDITKRIAESNFGDEANGRVFPGWLLLARSGQTYGLNGSLVLATEALKDKVISDHVMRIAPTPRAKMRVGYTLTALSHPTLGRPVVKSLAYGSSIPEIDPTDFENLPVVRLKASTEDAIADLAEQSAALRAEADVLEREMAEEAGQLIDSFLAGDVVHFIVTMPAAVPSTTPASSPGSLPEHAVVRLRHALKADGLRKGAVGTIVHVYEGGAGYEVEFVKAGQRPKLATVEPADVELVEEA